MNDTIGKKPPSNNRTNDSETAIRQTNGQFFVVATPIGNLDDFSKRAQQTLSDASVILAEDTRHSKRLLNHYGINTRLRSCHDHNEKDQIEWVIERLSAGDDIALISDAGTPLISDPGYVIVRALREQGFAVSAVPGPSAVITALSISGLATDGFIFDGFLPAKSAARLKKLAEYEHQTRTVVVFESSHRIVASLNDCLAVLGENRRIVLARELTKRFETIIDGTIRDVLTRVQNDNDQTRGEFVLIFDGAEPSVMAESELVQWLNELLLELPIKKAAAIVAKVTGHRKNEVYDLALRIKKVDEA